MPTNEIQDQMRQACRRLLEEGKVSVIIGYGQGKPGTPAFPLFVSRPEDIEKLVWNDQCFSNLAAFVTRKDIKALGPAAIIVKGCDEKALVVLEQESQVDRNALYVIGVACEGVGNPTVAKCARCDVHNPRYANENIGKAPESVLPEGPDPELAAFLAKPFEERITYWTRELERCIKCYACRETCPMCYCNRCIVDKNRPAVLDTSSTLKGNFAWQITRAFHQAGRCVGCDECTRACPVGINLRLLNLTLAEAARDNFDGYRAGMDKETVPVIGSYSQQDKETFIQ